MSKPTGILIASHPRSGTHLLIDVIRRQFPATRSWRWWGQPLDYLYFNIERSTSANRHFDQGFRKKILDRPDIPLMKTHYLADWSSTWVEGETAPLPDDVIEAVNTAAVLYIHRDPREVMVSYKQFLSAIRPDVAAMDLMAFMASDHWSGGDMIGWWQKHVEGWLGRPGVTALSYRDLIKSPKETIERIGDVLGEAPHWRDPMLPAKVSTVSQTRRDRLFSLSPDSTGIVADRGRFPTRPWREVMSQDDHEWLEQRVGGLMQQLGYPLMAAQSEPVGNE